MRREQVVISGNDADIHRGAGADHRLILARSGKAVREVAARQVAAVGAGFALAVHQAQISGAARAAAGDDAVGDLGDGGVEVSHNSNTVCPELVSGPFFLSTPLQTDFPSTSPGLTEVLGSKFF